jgi:aryl-alcohol dehydrogenase-like predicted oxidoreductase
MRYKPLGSSGILVSELGYGTWGIGGATEGASSYGQTDDKESVRALETAYDNGINFFDTASAYGRSEEILGNVFGARRSNVIIATKVGISRHFAQQDFSKAAILASVTNSLRKLNTNYIDLLQLYNPPLGDIDLDDILFTMTALRDEGYIRAIGVSVKSPAEGLIALRYPDIVSIQTNLNMIDQRALDNGLLAAAKDRNVAIIARTPLCFGFLTGKIKELNFQSQDHRSQWPKEQMELWLKAAGLFSEILPPNWPLTHMALRFCMDSPGVASVIAGPITSVEVIDNMLSTELPELTSETVTRIKNIYKENDEFLIKK